MLKKEIKTLPVDTYSSSKGYLTYNPTKIDVIPVALNSKQEYLDKYYTSTSDVPLKRSNSNICYETSKNNHYSSQYINNTEYCTQNISNDCINHNEINLNPSSTNFLGLFNSSNLKYTFNMPKSSYLAKNTNVNKCSSPNIHKEPNFDSNKEFCNSFSSIFKDTQSILNGEETSQNKTEDNIQDMADINLAYIKAEPGSPIEESNPLPDTDDQNCWTNLFRDSYQHIRSGLSDGEHSTNSGDNFDIDRVKNESIEDQLMRRNIRTEKNKLRMRTKRELQRQTETPEARSVRLLQLREAARVRRRQESIEKRIERLKRDREKKRIYRAKLKEDDNYEDVLAKNRILMRLRRQDESFRQKERERDRIRHQIKRTNVEYREKEKVKERERKRLTRFLKKYAEQYTGFENFAQHLFSTHSEKSENI